MQRILIGLPDRGLRQFLNCQLEGTLGAPPGKLHGETTAYQGMIRVDIGTPVRAAIEDATTPSVTYGYVVNLGPSLASYRWTPSGTSAPTVSKNSATKKQLVLRTQLQQTLTVVSPFGVKPIITTQLSF